MSISDLNVSDAQELALMLVEFRSLSAAKVVLEDLNGRTGERYPKPNYYYGHALLDDGDPRGLDFLEEAFKLSPAMGDDCAKAGYHWLCEKKDEVAAENWVTRLQIIHTELTITSVEYAESVSLLDRIISMELLLNQHRGFHCRAYTYK